MDAGWDWQNLELAKGPTSAIRNASDFSRPGMKLKSVGVQRQHQLGSSVVCPKQIDTTSSPTSKKQAQSEQSLTFKRWARGTCYRCLAPGHQVRSCKDYFRCILCRCPGHRERFCHLRTLSSSSRVHYSEELQLPQSVQCYQQTKTSQGHQQTGCWTDTSSRHHSPQPTDYASGSPLQGLQSKALRSELEHLLETHFERVLHSIREELSTLKLWLARVVAHVECHVQDKEHGSALNIGELFGPYSPVWLSSTSTILDSLVPARTTVDPLRCESVMDGMTEPTVESPSRDTHGNFHQEFYNTDSSGSARGTNGDTNC